MEAVGIKNIKRRPDMTINDLRFEPHGDMELDDLETVNNYTNLISKKCYDDAQDVLINEKYKKGYTATFFNYLQDKLRQIQMIVLNKTAAPDEFYSAKEPTEDQMAGKTFWIQPID